MTLLDHPKKDFLSFYLPGILSLIILRFFSRGIAFDWGLLIIAYYFSDAGHVYTSLLKWEWTSPTEFKRVIYPFILFTVAIFSAISFQVKFFWSVLIYVTFWHNLKQAYGISAWYQAKTNQKKSYLKPLFYLANIVSLFALHFRSDLPFEKSYPMAFIFRFPNENLFIVFLSFSILLFIFLIIERAKFGEGINSRTYPIFMTLIYFYSFILSKNVHEILIPLLITHGLSYMALIYHSGKKVFSKNQILPIFFLSALGGFLDWFFLDEKALQTTLPLLHHFIRAMIFGAIFTHYYLDGILWKKDHPHSKVLLER